MDNSISRQSIVVARKEMLSAELQEERIILDLNSGCYFGLNSVASSIWSLIEMPRPVSEILNLLVVEYRVEPQQCEQDVLSLLQSLFMKGLIQVKSEVVA